VAEYDVHRAEALRLAVAYLGPGQPPKNARLAVGVARVFEQFLIDGTVLDEPEKRKGEPDASSEPVPVVARKAPRPAPARTPARPAASLETPARKATRRRPRP
jgi:hypothetical protein